jgi:hypothetical protein
MVSTARRSILRVVLSVVFLSLSTEPAAVAGNVTVTDVRELAGFCEAYLQTHTDWFRTAIAQIVEERWSDPSGGLLVGEERASVDDDRATYDAAYGNRRPVFQGTGGIHVYRLVRRLSRSH